MRVSNSEIQCFKGCRRKWWLSYYRGLRLKRETPVGARSLGTRVHDSLALYYDMLRIGHPEAFAVSSALVRHDRLVAADIEGVPEAEAELRKDGDLGRAMLEGYFDWLQETGADQGLQVEAAEEVVDFTYEVPAGGTVTPVTIGAKLDLRVRDTNVDAPMFLDHKTVQEFTTPTKSLHLDEQMVHYNWLLQKVTGQRVHGAIYNMLRKVKRTASARPPFYERFTVAHSQEEMLTYESRLLGVLEVMLNTRRRLDEGQDPNVVCYPTPTRNCSWSCDFFPVCHLLNRPTDKPEHTIRFLYEEGDPYARYESAES